MTVNPADNKAKIATADILAKFLMDIEMGEGSFASLQYAASVMYNLEYVDEEQMRASLCRGKDVNLRNQGRFIYLEAIEDKGLLPFVTIQSTQGWVHFRVYVLLTMLGPAGKPRALAIRYETDEGSGTGGNMGSHDFCHAQLCRSITKKAIASNLSWLPESQPSIPLEAKDQVTLVLCMLVSLYGARYVRRKLIESGERNLRKYIDCLRALQNNTVANGR